MDAQRSDTDTLLNAVKAISMADYDYPLPNERIAQSPCAPRDAAKLLIDSTPTPTDSHFTLLNQFLPPQALLVVNDSKVIHARLAMQRPSGGRFELFLLDPAQPASYEESFASRGPVQWHALMGRAQRWRDDIACSLGCDPRNALLAKRLAPYSSGEGIVELAWQTEETLAEILERLGKIPIPPYLGRKAVDNDNIWYQTVYARHEGSVAAPTAGLHLTDTLLNALQANGHPLLRTTLHVGAGTFLPVKGGDISEHNMHCERIIITRQLTRSLLAANAPIVAVGTTSMRTLESLYWLGALLIDRPTLSPLHLPQWTPYQHADTPPLAEALRALLLRMDALHTDSLDASTALIIAPGYHFHVVDALLTNFHQPRSTLLLLVAAFIGERWRALYEHALRSNYRFLSYGDGMLLFNRKGLHA